MDLQCITHRLGDTVVLAITGLADLSTAPRLHTAVRNAIGEHAGERVLIDLDGLSAVDDAALGVLLGAAAHARELGGDVELVCSSEPVRRRLFSNRIDELVRVSPSISDAGDRHEGDGYTAVIFTNQRTDADHDGYGSEASRMEHLAAEQPGFIGIESVRGADGLGVTVSYWASPADARDWKHQSDHLLAQRAGRERWYRWYRVRIATVEREYFYDQGHVSHEPDTGPT
jgi:anti-anti-sigma factor